MQEDTTDKDGRFFMDFDDYKDDGREGKENIDRCGIQMKHHKFIWFISS